jgi:hypothetical protein
VTRATSTPIGPTDLRLLTEESKSARPSSYALIHPAAEYGHKDERWEGGVIGPEPVERSS